MAEAVYSDQLPRCTACNELVKPGALIILRKLRSRPDNFTADITFFGEQLPKRFYDCVMGDFGACDLLIVIGAPLLRTNSDTATPNQARTPCSSFADCTAGTSLQVQPFASLISFADKRVPRLLINREKVARYNPLMALLGGPADGFLFDETYVSLFCDVSTRVSLTRCSVNYRDVYCGGEIQDNIKQLAALIGWGDELERLVAEGHATVPAAAAKSP